MNAGENRIDTRDDKAVWLIIRRFVSQAQNLPWMASFYASNETAHAYFEIPSNPALPTWFVSVFASINGAGLLLNAFSLLLLVLKKFAYRYKINMFIASLCASDLLVSLASFYFLATISVDSLSSFSKRVATIIYSFSLETSLVSLCCMSVDRLVAVHKPFQYNEILSKNRVYFIIALGWAFCIALLALQMLFGIVYKSHRYVYFNWIVFILMAAGAIFVLLCVYLYLIYEIHRHSVHIKACSVKARQDDPIIPYSASDYADSDVRTEVTFASSSAASSPSSLPRPSIDIYVNQSPPSIHSGNLMNNPRENQHLARESAHLPRAERQKLLRSAVENSRGKRSTAARKRLVKKERKSVMLCFSIVVVFVVCWMPVIVYFSRCIGARTCETDDRLLFICSCLVSFNSLLDPILYFILKREFKQFLFGKICNLSSAQRKNSASFQSRSRGGSGNFV